MSENPADIASRGIKATALKESSLWLHGPEFLSKDKAPRQLWSMGVVKSLITGRDGYHRGAVVRVRSGDRVVEMTRPLNRLYPVEVESQVREERQNRNTDFPITFVGNAEQEHVSEH